MAILKVERKIYKYIRALLSLSVTNTLNGAVEKVRFAKTDFHQTHFFNGSNQRICYTKRQ